MSDIPKETLIEEYSQYILEGKAAIFAGAGISIASGYPTWSSLLEKYAKKLNIDITREYDLAKLAQYYVNEKNGSKSDLCQHIKRTLASNHATVNENISIISSLPIENYWTTNYDDLLETGIKKANRQVDVFIHEKDIPYRSKNSDAVVYKMHGDINYPSDIVITKKDYVVYDKTRELFKTFLKIDLISKHFLFLGFSFNDPNINHILDSVYYMLDGDPNHHYYIEKRVSKNGHSESEYEYLARKQRYYVVDPKK